ncbi:ATP synthase F1 subunit gamma [Calditrichota bacterium]
MASLKQIKRRIVGVSSTKQITRAMKMVSAAKLRKSQENMERSRPYAHKLRDVIYSLANHADADMHPLLEVREAEHIGVVTVTSDRGMCGSFNANICRRTQNVISDFSDLDVKLFTLGKRGQEFFRKRGADIYHFYPGVFQELEFSQAAAIGRDISDKYVAGDFDRIYLVYNEFKNAIQQNIICQQLLPVETSNDLTSASNVDYIYEPDSRAVLNSLLPMYINVQIWHVMLESFAAEQAARMTAMEAATDNASELIDALTLQFNKARQAAITTELNEIVGGAEGLK